MKRREFVEKAGLGAAALVTIAATGPARASTRAGAQHHHNPISGPLATATVSFGAWAQTPAPGGDRHPNLGAAAGLANNVHALIPNEVKIKAGGTVNYIIAGFHQVIVYDDGMTPADIDHLAVLIPGLPPLIDDPNRRVYRGIESGHPPAAPGPSAGRVRSARPRSTGAAGPCRSRSLPEPRYLPGDLRRAAALQRRNGWLRQGHSVVMLAG